MPTESQGHLVARCPFILRTVPQAWDKVKVGDVTSFLYLDKDASRAPYSHAATFLLQCGFAGLLQCGFAGQARTIRNRTDRTHLKPADIEAP